MTLISNMLISPGDDSVFICNWHYPVKIEKLSKKSVYTSLACVTQISSEPEQVVYVTGDHCILTPEPLCPPLQVYGSVARSTDTASSGAGRLPGSGIVSQTLWARSAAGAQGNWCLLLCPGALLWSSWDSSPHWCTTLVMLRMQTWEPSGQREFPSRLWKQSTLLLSDKDFPLFTSGCLFLFFTSGNKLAFYFRLGSQILGGLGPKSFLTSGQDLFLISFWCS